MTRFGLHRLPRLCRFVRSEDGAVSVDYVVMTAAVVFMVLALFTVLTETIFSETAQAIVDDMRQVGNW